MKKLVLAALVAFFASTLVHAADLACATKAAEKKLSGAAKNSFLKKCEKDAAAAPSAVTNGTAKAADKKLAGAAKTSGNPISGRWMLWTSEGVPVKWVWI